jgi:EasF-like predicted methyltransferase
VNILLQAIEHLKKDVEYYALDLDLDELRRTFSAIPATGYKHVKCFGLHGTYHDGLEWLGSPHIVDKPKTILWLGSSIGNFERHDAKSFLRDYQDALKVGDALLIGIDGCKDPSRVYHAYNDKHNVTHQFILNGLTHANKILGDDSAFDPQDWKVIGEFNRIRDCHQAFLSPMRDVTVDGVSISKGEKIRIEESHKYSAEETSALFSATQLVEGCKWTTQRGDYGMYYHLIFHFMRGSRTSHRIHCCASNQTNCGVSTPH